jgi:hypothetical protein
VERGGNGNAFVISTYSFGLEDQFGGKAVSESAMIRLKTGRFMSPPPFCPRAASFDQSHLTWHDMMQGSKRPGRLLSYVRLMPGSFTGSVHNRGK